MFVVCIYVCVVCACLCVCSVVRIYTCMGVCIAKGQAGDENWSENTPLTAAYDVENQQQLLAQAQQQQQAQLNQWQQQNVYHVDVMEVARQCRLIRLFAIIDCILIILFAFWGDLFFLIGLPLAACGYLGAKKLNRNALV